MQTFSHNLLLLPYFALLKPRLFFYCSLHAWLAWPFFIVGAVGVGLFFYPSAYQWLTNQAYPSILYKMLSWQSYSQILYYLPRPIQLPNNYQAYLLPVSLGLITLSYPIMALQLPHLLASAEKKAWRLLKLSEKLANKKGAKRQATRCWKKAFALLTKAAQKDLYTLFPKPGSSVSMKKKAVRSHLEGVPKEQVAKIQQAKSRQLPTKQQGQGKPFKASTKTSAIEDVSKKGSMDFVPVDRVKSRPLVDTASNTHAAITSQGIQQRHIQTVQPRKLSATKVKRANRELITDVAPNVMKVNAGVDTSKLPCKIGIDQRYELQNEIAKGGMGVVFGGMDTTLKRPVAVKQLYQHLCSDPEQLDRFKQEALLLAQLNHPNIVPIYDLIDHQQQVWIVMEWLTAGCLDDMLEEAMLPLTLSINIIKEMAGALDMAHRHNIIHRDIKPMNILMTQTGSAKLSDFGTAKFSQSVFETQEGLAIGSPAYMSPEQAAGQDVDARSDIYSLGITFYQLATGQLPFTGDTIAMMSQHITQVAKPPMEVSSSVNQPLSDVIMKMIEKKPSDRFQSMKEVLERIS